ncbi:MAG: hypothetical protein PHY59_09440 [Methanobacterium sp.]|nr:hypothetical protein [Methanobacterium sp.]
MGGRVAPHNINNHPLPHADWLHDFHFNNGYDTAKLLNNAFIIVGFLSGVACLVCGILYRLSEDSLSDLNSQLEDLKRDWADLNSYAVTSNLSVPVAGCLNFTTHEGCPVNDTLNGSSIYDSPLGYNSTSKPLNGNLVLGKMGDFIYK